MEQYRETLLWILDKQYTKHWDGDEMRERIAFVHSLGLKCDAVGWSTLDLARPDSPAIAAEWPSLPLFVAEALANEA